MTKITILHNLWYIMTLLDTKLIQINLVTDTVRISQINEEANECWAFILYCWEVVKTEKTDNLLMMINKIIYAIRMS